MSKKTKTDKSVKKTKKQDEILNKEVTQEKVNNLAERLYDEITNSYKKFVAEGTMEINLPAYIYTLIHSVAEFTFNAAPTNVAATLLLVEAFSDGIKNNLTCDDCGAIQNDINT